MATLKKATPAKKTAAPAAKTAPAKKTAPARKAPARSAAARPAKPTWDAPADFKPAFFDFRFSLDSQALIIPASCQGMRVKGRWDNPEAKTYDLREYDMNTLIGFFARLSAAIWAPNVLRRVTPETSYRMIVRCNRRAADGTLAVRIVGLAHKSEGKKAKWFEDKSNPDFRKFRRAARWLPAAFTDVQLPPSRRKAKAEETTEEE